jgi:hypothetical protein
MLLHNTDTAPLPGEYLNRNGGFIRGKIAVLFVRSPFVHVNLKYDFEILKKLDNSFSSLSIPVPNRKNIANVFQLP